MGERLRELSPIEHVPWDENRELELGRTHAGCEVADLAVDAIDQFHFRPRPGGRGVVRGHIHDCSPSGPRQKLVAMRFTVNNRMSICEGRRNPAAGRALDECNQVDDAETVDRTSRKQWCIGVDPFDTACPVLALHERAVDEVEQRRGKRLTVRRQLQIRHARTRSPDEGATRQRLRRRALMKGGPPVGQR